MSKHTDGPWYVSGYKGDGVHNLFLCAKASMMILADLNSVHVDSPANARLIAAAPELLEALKSAEKFLTCAYDDEQERKFIAEECRAAIAKASPPAHGDKP